MPEYRRFIAYFYEYINGKKQKNAGFAKVELRNGMWRILFRLTADVVPEEPIQVYGFVREQGYLLGFPMGVMRSGKEIVEEWAYRAELPIGKEKYRLADFSGIWIQSGDGRCFATVWDDEGLNPEKFVLELPKKDREEMSEEAHAPEMAEAEKATNVLEEADGGQDVLAESIPNPVPIEVMAVEEPAMEETTAEDMAIEEPVMEETAAEDMAVEDTTVEEMVGEYAASSRRDAHGEKEKMMEETELDHLFKRRNLFQPFQDEEITECVQILPCDIAWLQQKDWKVGRSSFLQHGFYQYRHLLLGRMADGTCVIGVPGIRNPQEKYMAEMFGYDRFKMSKLCECGRTFGYWYRPLVKKCRT